MSMTLAVRPIEILLIEDNPADIELAEEALCESTVPISLNIAHDGEEALRFLRAEGEYAGVERPDLILLDLKVPKKDGLEVLAEVKADRALRRIPVVVLSSSDADEDIVRAYDLRASSYIIKPSDLPRCRQVLRSLRDFCLAIVKLPPRD